MGARHVCRLEPATAELLRELARAHSTARSRAHSRAHAKAELIEQSRREKIRAEGGGLSFCTGQLIVQCPIISLFLYS